MEKERQSEREISVGSSSAVWKGGEMQLLSEMHSSLTRRVRWGAHSLTGRRVPPTHARAYFHTNLLLPTILCHTDTDRPFRLPYFLWCLIKIDSPQINTKVVHTSSAIVNIKARLIKCCLSVLMKNNIALNVHYKNALL